MTTRTLVLAALLVAGCTGSAFAQPPAPPAEPAQAPRAPATLRTPEAPAAPLAPKPPAPPRREGQAINIKVELELTDQRAGAAPIKRTVTVIAADGYTGSIRTQSQVVQVGAVPLNVDASPTLLADGKIRLAINLQYDWPALAEGGGARGTVTSTSLHDQLMLILENGKPIIAAQSADPVGDRQVTVEVKATILK
jgi:hypothetical protein